MSDAEENEERSFTRYRGFRMTAAPLFHKFGLFAFVPGSVG